VGDPGSDLLDGGTGDDSLEGGADDDTYLVDAAGDTVTELAGEGVDTVRSSVSYALGVNVENLTLTQLADDFGQITAQAQMGTGNELDNVLIGNDGDNVLYGLAGNDMLDGGRGADTMAGGADDDTYVVDSAQDAVLESAGEGNDTVRSLVSYTLGNTLENITLLGVSDLSATGNDGDNVLTGNAGHNLLTGGAGNDTYVFGRGSGQDVVVDASGGEDRIRIRGDLTSADLKLSRTEFDLGVAIIGTTDTLTVKNWFAPFIGAHAEGEVEGIFFEDGSDALTREYIHLLLDNHPPVAVDDSNATVEDSMVVLSGNVLDNDTDEDLAWDNKQFLSVVTAGEIQGQFGKLVLSEDGQYTYVLDNSLLSVQSLAQNAKGYDIFAYTISDHAYDPRTSTAHLTVEVTGTNDGPVLSVAPADQFGHEGTLLTYTVPDTVFTDIDVGDVLTYRGYMLNAQGQEMAMPSWLSFDAATRTFKALAGLDQATVLRMGVEVTDPWGLKASASYTLTMYDSFALPDDPTRIVGDGADNILNGLWMDETIDGGAGSDRLYGGTGNDTLRGGDGNDQLYGEAGTDLLDGGAGDDTLYMNVEGNWSDSGKPPVLTDANAPTYGVSAPTTSLAGANRTVDVFEGGTGTDALMATSGNDGLRMDETGVQKISGIEVFDLGWGNDVLDLSSTRFAYGDTLVKSGWGNDVAWGNAGNDILQGQDGNDQLSGGAGNDVLDGASGDDALIAGAGDDKLFGGKGNETLYAGAGRDLLAFNKGDGIDTVVFAADGVQSDVISLGGGIKYADIKLRKTGNDLVMDLGSGDLLTFSQWYANASSKTVSRLQVVTIGGDYSAVSNDKTKNRMVEVFDFQKIVSMFDSANNTARNKNVNSWGIVNSLTPAWVTASDSQALGGDLPYQYALTGSLSGIGLESAQASLAAGTDWQTLKSRGQLEQGSARLA
jgi:VCBS repeat-containing protein